MDPVAFCRERAAPAGSSFYYATLFSAGPATLAALALEALRLELWDIIDTGTDAEATRTRLHWWANEIAGIDDGSARHPVSLALGPAVREGRLPSTLLHRPVRATADLIERSGFSTVADRDAFCAGTWGACAEATAIAGGDLCASGRAGNLGRAIGRAALLRPRGGWGPPLVQALPVELRERHGLANTDFSSGPTPDGLRTLLAEECAAIGRDLDEGLASESSRALLPITILARFERVRLRALARIDYRVAERRGGITPLRKLWIAWRSSAGAAPGLTPPGESV